MHPWLSCWLRFSMSTMYTWRSWFDSGQQSLSQSFILTNRANLRGHKYNEWSSLLHYSHVTGQSIYFYITILSCLHLYILPFCALSQAWINLINPGTEMRQNVNSTVITASHQSNSAACRLLNSSLRYPFSCCSITFPVFLPTASDTLDIQLYTVSQWLCFHTIVSSKF